LQRRPPEGLIAIGRVAGSYGLRGWVKVAPEQGTEETLAAASEWWLGPDCFEVSASKVHGATVLAKLAGIETRERARELKGRTVAVRREALPDPGEGKYYIADLIGLDVVNEQDERLGVVKRTYWNGAQDVIEVAGDRTRLIPWVPAVVKQVDLPKRRVRVEWAADW
jgi:16S rRNA processing protein RimM